MAILGIRNPTRLRLGPRSSTTWSVVGQPATDRDQERPSLKRAASSGNPGPMTVCTVPRLLSSNRLVASDSLYTLAAVFNVDAATIRREQRRAGTLIRRRSGWPNSVR